MLTYNDLFYLDLDTLTVRPADFHVSAAVPGPTARELRGRELHAAGAVTFEGWRWRVVGSKGDVYTVRAETHPCGRDRLACTCPDFQHRGGRPAFACAHVHAALCEQRAHQAR